MPPLRQKTGITSVGGVQRIIGGHVELCGAISAHAETVQLLAMGGVVNDDFQCGIRGKPELEVNFCV